jgi:hypothetical protein
MDEPYGSYFGTVSYTCPRGVLYKTLVMTKTGPYIKVNRKIYPLVEGYLQVKPFVD